MPKISDLTLDSAPSADDLIVTVDQAGTPTTKKATLAAVTGGRELGYAEITANQTFTGIGSANRADITGLSVTVTVGTRPILVTAHCTASNNTADVATSFGLIDTADTATLLAQGVGHSSAAGLQFGLDAQRGAHHRRHLHLQSDGMGGRWHRLHRRRSTKPGVHPSPRTMSLAWSRGVGAYRTSEIHTFITDRLYKPNGTRRGIIFAHGVGQGGDSQAHSGPVSDKLLTLAAAGYPVITADLSAATYAGANWGNTDHVNAVAAAFTYLTTVGGAKTDKVGVLGSSMGTLSLNWVRLHKTQVFAFAATIPVLDMTDIYNDGAYTAGILAAYGGTYPPADIAQREPVQYVAGDLTGLTIKLWTSSNDPIASPTAQALAWDGRGATKAVTDLGPVGHDATTASPAEVLGFFDAYGGRQ